jgi:NADPH:quinone reductase-like Zn-dependent oxidoreductase
MKAVIANAYGGPEVYKIRNVEKPIPKKNEIRVRVVAASMTTADTMMREGTPRFARLVVGFTKPKRPIPGTGFSGYVDEIGEEVTNFMIDEEVFGLSGLSFGTHAEYVCVAEDSLVLRKPSYLSCEEAAVLSDGALTSMNFLTTLSKIKKGDSVLINGASGSLGSCAVQIAKSMGAVVTGVCSGSNMDFVYSLGADFMIDYQKQDFVDTGLKYHLIYDTVGKSNFKDCESLLLPNGVYLSPVLTGSILWPIIKTGITGRKKAKFGATGILEVCKQKGLMKKVLELIELGKLNIVIDKKFLMANVVDGHYHLGSGKKYANSVLFMA